MLSHKRKVEAEVKRNTDRQVLLSEAIASRILPILDNNIKPLMQWDFYPELFREEKEHYEKMQAQSNFESFKERRRKFAAQHNKARKEVDE